MQNSNQNIGWDWPTTKARKFYDLNMKWSALVKESVALEDKGAISETLYNEVIENWNDYKIWFKNIDLSALSFYFGDFMDEFRTQSMRYNELQSLVSEEARRAGTRTRTTPISKRQFNTMANDISDILKPVQGFGGMIIIGMVLYAIIQAGKK
jgi:hypothetical protein